VPYTSLIPFILYWKSFRWTAVSVYSTLWCIRHPKRCVQHSLSVFICLVSYKKVGEDSEESREALLLFITLKPRVE